MSSCCFLVWTNSSVCSDDTKSNLAGFICRNSTLLQKHQHVSSKHNTDQSTIARSRQMTQIQQKGTHGWPILKRKTVQNIFFTSVLTIAGEILTKCAS